MRVMRVAHFSPAAPLVYYASPSLCSGVQKWVLLWRMSDKRGTQTPIIHNLFLISFQFELNEFSLRVEYMNDEGWMMKEVWGNYVPSRFYLLRFHFQRGREIERLIQIQFDKKLINNKKYSSFIIPFLCWILIVMVLIRHIL